MRCDRLASIRRPPIGTLLRSGLPSIRPLPIGILLRSELHAPNRHHLVAMTRPFCHAPMCHDSLVNSAYILYMRKIYIVASLSAIMAKKQESVKTSFRCPSTCKHRDSANDKCLHVCPYDTKTFKRVAETVRT